MARLSQLETYLRRARQADLAQERAKTREEKMAWEQVAVGYLELAELTRSAALKRRVSLALVSS
jgi:hypothetical protein